MKNDSPSTPPTTPPKHPTPPPQRANLDYETFRPAKLDMMKPWAFHSRETVSESGSKVLHIEGEKESSDGVDSVNRDMVRFMINDCGG